MSKKLHITNIPLSLATVELVKALQQITPSARGRVYMKDNKSMGCGDCTFELACDCEDFMRQIKVHPMKIQDKVLRFEHFVTRKEAEQAASGAPKKSFRMIGKLPADLADSDTKEIMAKIQKAFKQVSAITFHPIVTNAVKMKTKNVQMIPSDSKYTPEQTLKLLEKFSKFRLDKDIDVKNEAELTKVRIIIRNLPNCEDEDLTKQLNELIIYPFKHIKRVKNFCFVTFYCEEDAVAVVKSGQIMMRKRPVIPDFTSDEMRAKYADAVIEEESSAFEPPKEELKSISVSDSESEEEQPKLEIEEFDKKKGIQTYLKATEEKSEEQNEEEEEEENDDDEHTDVQAEPSDEGTRETKLKDLQEFIQDNQTEQIKQQQGAFEDQYTLFVSNVPVHLPLNILEEAQAGLKSKNIQVNDQGHLLEVTVRRQVANLFLQFGKLRKVALPLDEQHKLKGTAFVQFEREKDFKLCLQFIEALKKMKSEQLKVNNTVLKKQENWKPVIDKNAEALIGQIQLGQAQDDTLFQQQIQERELNGFSNNKTEQIQKQYEELYKIRRVAPKHLNTNAGCLKLFENNLVVYEFVTKKLLDKQHQKVIQNDTRNVHLLKFGMKIPGMPGYADFKIQKKDEEFRVRYYHKAKHLLKNVNYHCNPQRVEMRNFEKTIDEEKVMCGIWHYLVRINETEKIFKNENIQKHLKGPVPSYFKGIQKWSELLENEASRKQVKISEQQIALIAESLKLKSIRIPQTEVKKCFDMVRNLKEVRNHLGAQLVGVVYFESVDEEASKRLITLLDNKPIFGAERKPVCAFGVENVGRLKEVKDWRKQKSDKQ
ncbi:RNA_binding protein [Hexamita inflata]|uniref:Putative n=1 Tax=Hexamita inflata TaxID=28002 RepID=A0ABP1I219_9EUKA